MGLGHGGPGGRDYSEASVERRDQSVTPSRTLRKTSSLTRNPPKINSTPMNSPRKKDHVTPNRLRPLVTPGMNAPAAIRIVAGTRELSLPATSAAAAPGRDATMFTAMAAAPYLAGS